VRIYSAAKVARMLAENKGQLTIWLGWFDAAWMPHPARDLYAPAISGPGRVTYTALDNGLVKFDVIRRDDPWVFAPPTQHGVGPAPTQPSSRRQRKAHVLVWGAVVIYLCLTVTGFAVGYGPIGRHALVAGLAGAIGGYLAAYVVNLGVVIAFHTWRIRHPQAARDSDPVE
jgi:hypothetical protein